MAELSTLGSVIKTAYEAEDNTNAFTDPEKLKLGGIQDEATKNATDAALRDRSLHTGTQTASTIEDLPDLLNGKVDAVPGKDLSDVNFTQEEKDKLSALEDAHFKGVHVGLQALELAYPTASVGDYATVDQGVDGVNWFAWDDVTSAWVVRAGESAELTPAQVKTLYEGNPDTNAFTDDDKDKLAEFEGRFAWRRMGTWNAETNTPTLSDGGGTNGDFYVVTTPGSQFFGSTIYEFGLYDWALFSGGTWSRIAASYAPTWSSISNKPAVIAAGTTQQAARDVIGALPDTYQPDWSDIQNKPALSGGGNPIGTVLQWFSSVLPDGYIWADMYVPGEYPALDAVYPSGVPDFTNRVFRHVGDLTGAVGTTQEDAMQPITGTFDNVWMGGPTTTSGALSRSNGANAARPAAGTQGNARINLNSANSPGARTADETRVKSVIFRAIIKAY